MLKALVCAAGLLAAETAAAYPLDGYPETGIRRLLGISLAVQGVIRDVAQPPGALLPMKDVDLRLEGQTFDLPSPDPAFTGQVKGLLGGQLGGYGLAVLDVHRSGRPRYAEHRGDDKQNVGSVGKIVVRLALFQARATLPRRHRGAPGGCGGPPSSPPRLLAVRPPHRGMFDPDETLTRRPIQIGDRASLWEYVDWMRSRARTRRPGWSCREAHAAPAVRPRVSPAEAETAVSSGHAEGRPHAPLRQDLLRAVTRNGLDLDRLRQGSVFTAGGKRVVPGRETDTGRPGISCAISGAWRRAGSRPCGRAVRSSA